MNGLKQSCFLLIFNFLFSICIAENSLPSYVSYGAYAVRMDSKEVLIDENSSKSLMPASCLKIVTTIAALHLLEPIPFKTVLQYDGIIKKKTLFGNIFIKGGGDPALGSGRGLAPSFEKQIAIWVEAIAKLGIERIEGNIIGDGSVWEKALAVPSWSWEDIGNYYGIGASGLSFKENFYTVSFKGGKEGEKAEILQTDPKDCNLHSEVKIGPKCSSDLAYIYGCEYFLERYIRGTIPEGGEFSIKGSIADPPSYCALLLKDALLKKGILINQKKIKEGKRNTFHETFSLPLNEIVFFTNQKSINLYAEHLLKKIGEVTYKEGSTEGGLKGIYDFLHKQNIDLKGFNMVDGSGLSRKNLITAKQLVSLLVWMKKSPHFLSFYMSLPEYGDIRAKSGSMSYVKCYAGYLGNIAFAFLINNSLEDTKESVEHFFSRLRQLQESSKIN